MNNWEPRVGQKVVALVSGDALPAPVKKGDVFTVLAVKKLCCCWHVDVGLLSPKTTAMKCRHHGTLLNLVAGEKLWPESKVFAPLIEYPDLTAEIAQQFKEHPDTADVPVKELEVQN